jgi:hypothetical protein
MAKKPKVAGLGVIAPMLRRGLGAPHASKPGTTKKSWGKSFSFDAAPPPPVTPARKKKS